eukprot:m.97543 g.97543  ORF g.97543 m.97543 type:complete len:1386 (-) comp26987_c0_seq1:199-4356(-)
MQTNTTNTGMAEDRNEVFHTALAVVPPTSLFSPINAIRELHDKAFARWMPHFNINFPFFEALEQDGMVFDAALVKRVEHALEKIPAFECRLDHFSTFKKTGLCTVFLEPNRDGVDGMVKISNAMDNEFPELALKQKRPFKPHLTVGQWQQRELDTQISRLNKDWTPLKWDVDHVCLLSRVGTEGMVVRHIVKLGTNINIHDTSASDTITPGITEQKLSLFVSPGVPYARLAGNVGIVSKETVAAAVPTGTTHLILVLDRSGSMSGGPYTAILKALEEVDALLTETSHMNVTLIFYNDTVRVCVVKKGGSTASQIARQNMPGSVTNFQIAFDAVRKTVGTTESGDQVRVVFMTDGDANRGDSNKGLADFSLWARKTHCENVVVDILAFKSSDNVKFLNSIKDAGTSPGFYRFCNATSELSGMLVEIFDTVGSATNCSVQMELEFPQTMRVIGTDSCDGIPTSGWPKTEDRACVQISLWVTKPLAGTRSCEIVVQGVVTEVEVHTLSGNRGGSKYVFSLDFVERRIFELCAQGNPKMADTEKLQEMLRGCQQIFKDRSVTKPVRLEVLERKQEVQIRLDKLHDLVSRGARKNVAQDNVVLSEMSSLRYDGAVKSARRQRMLHRRAAANVHAADDIAHQLATLTYDEKDLPSDSDTLDFYSCMLTCENVREVMADAPDQVLGFGLAVRRSEDVVDAPSLIKIAGISTSVISRSAMLDAIRFKLSVEDQVSVHGGFDLSAELGVATVGRSREPINAWLPLYVCEAHWQRQRLLLKPTLGFFCCMDPLAYDDKQLWVLLAVLGTMATRVSQPSFGERELKLLCYFRDTCRAVARDEPDFNTLLRNKLSAFVTDPAARFKDTVQNLTTMVGALLVVEDSMARDLLEKGFWDHLIVESVRRGCNILFKHQAPGTEFEVRRTLLGVTTKNDELTADEMIATLTHLRTIVGGDDDSDTAFQGWVEGLATTASTSSPSTTPSLELEAQLATRKTGLPNGAVRLMARVGLKVQGSTPGPNIQDKEAKIEQRSRTWWDEQVLQARKMLGDVASVSFQTTHASVKCTSVLLDQLARVMFPKVGAWHAASVLTNLLAAPKRVGGIDASGDTEASDERDETPHTQRDQVVKKEESCIGGPLLTLGELRKHVLKPKLSLLEALPARDEPSAQQVVQMVQSLLLQCVSGHSNKVARGIASRKEWVDRTVAVTESGELFATKACQATINELKELSTSQDDAVARGCVVSIVNVTLVATPDIDAFIGLLSMAHTNRDTPYYTELLRKLLDISVELPLRGDKIEILVTGQWKGKRVFASGNPSFPSDDVMKDLEGAIGLDRVTEIRNSVTSRTCTGWLYRASDIANRHNHRNSNPSFFKGPCSCYECMRIVQHTKNLKTYKNKPT